ncbi:MAG: hypothetical protein HPY74_18690 [Firmicutes bacterium]|nr:hypothetical protein [Bacillota bacterium]
MLMKKFNLNVFLTCAVICLVTFITIPLTGCTTQLMDTGSKIVVPEIKAVPLQGKWEIENILSYSDTFQEGDPFGEWIGKIVELGKNSLLIGENYWEDVNYRVRRVNAEEYFLFRLGGYQEKLGLEDEEIYVVTASSQEKFLYEFIDINKDRAIVNIEDQYFFMKKLSDQISDISDIPVEKKLSSRAGGLYEQGKGSTSGILLGLRTPIKSDISDKKEGWSAGNNLPKFRYRTLWIALKDYKLQPVLEAEEIFLPRISGFWKVGVKEKTDGEKTEEVLYAYSITEDESRRTSASKEWNYFWNDKEGILRRTIVYAGNDYVSIELLGKGVLKENNNDVIDISANISAMDIKNGISAKDSENNGGKWEINMLQTLPVDNIESFKGIKLSDICGENGVLAMKNAIEKLVSSSGVQSFSDIDEKKQEENFALFRKTGHWFFKGRVNFENNSITSYQDYYINLIPPLRMVAYDNLHLPWTYIKDRIPQTVDAYTSPNNDFAIILTRDSLLIYAITEGKLSGMPLGKIKLDAGDTIVMAEWATGDYVKKWEKSFITNNNAKNVEVEKYK